MKWLRRLAHRFLRLRPTPQQPVEFTITTDGNLVVLAIAHADGWERTYRVQPRVSAVLGHQMLAAAMRAERNGVDCPGPLWVQRGGEC